MAAEAVQPTLHAGLFGGGQGVEGVEAALRHPQAEWACADAQFVAAHGHVNHAEHA